MADSQQLEVLPDSQANSSSGNDAVQVLTKEDVQGIVGKAIEDHEKTDADSEGRMLAALDGAKVEILSTVGASGVNRSLELVTSDDVFRFVPEGVPEYVGTYFTPVLWGIAAGLVCFLIGYLWEAFMRLLGLAGRK